MKLMRLRLFKRTDAPEYRLPFIEGIRGLAALYVVIGHICSMSDPRAFQGQTSHAPLWVQQAMAPFWNGHLAVAAFIVVSGFCLQMSLFPGKDGRIKRLGEYLKRRARRMLPAYYACLAASVAVCLTITVNQKGMPFEQYLPVTQQNVLAHLLLVHNWSPEWMYKLNGVLWSIAIEAQLYLVFPVLVFLAFRAGRLGTALITSMVGFGVVYQWPETVKLYPWYLALFTFGLLAAHLAYRPSLKQGTMPRLAMWSSLVLGVACLVELRQGAWLPLTDALGAGAVACLLYSGLTRPNHWFLKILGCRPLAWLGLFSYSLYLMHHPIQQILYVNRPAWASNEAGLFTYFLYCIPAILAGAWMFWWLFERPFLRRPNLYQSTHTHISPKLPAAVAVKVATSSPVVARRRELPAETLLEGAVEVGSPIAEVEVDETPTEAVPHR